MSKTKYKKKVKNGKEYYFYRLRHKNLTNPKDIYGISVKELESKIKSIRNELDNGITLNKELFETFFSYWLFDVHFLKIKPSTQERYEGIYRNYIKNSELSAIILKDLTAKNIQDYYNHLTKIGKTVSEIKNLNKLVAPCIRYAYNNNKIIKDFSKAVEVPTESEEKKLNKADKVNPFTIVEQKKFIEEIVGHELEMLFLTAINTGLREGELFALTWADVNFANNTVRVNKTVKNISNVSQEGRGARRIIVQTPKSAASNRTVPMPNFLVKRLKKYRVDQKELKLKMANFYEDNNLVFCNMYGRYLDSSNVLKRFKKVISKIGISDKKFHDLRHTYATRLFELGYEPKVIQTLLGHATITVTLDTYTHIMENIKKSAVVNLDKLNDLFINMGAK